MQAMERSPVHGLGLRFLFGAHLTDRVDTPGVFRQVLAHSRAWEGFTP